MPRSLGRLAVVAVGVVQAGRRDVVDPLAGNGLRLGDVDDVEDLGPAEAGDLHCTHGTEARGGPARDEFGNFGPSRENAADAGGPVSVVIVAIDDSAMGRASLLAMWPPAWSCDSLSPLLRCEVRGSLGARDVEGVQGRWRSPKGGPHASSATCGDGSHPGLVSRPPGSTFLASPIER